MAPTQPTNGSSARTRARARASAEGTVRPSAVRERPVRRSASSGARSGAAVVTVGKTTGRAGARCDSDRTRRRRVAQARPRARHGRRRRRRGHPPPGAAGARARRDRRRSGGVLLRGQRVSAHARPGRGDAGRGAGAAGHRRGHAERLGPWLPARRRGPGCGRRGGRRTRPLGGADGARGVRSARRPLLLRRLPPAQGGRAGPASRGPRPRAADDGVLRGPAPHARPRWPRWPRPSATIDRRRCAAS